MHTGFPCCLCCLHLVLQHPKTENDTWCNLSFLVETESLDAAFVCVLLNKQIQRGEYGTDGPVIHFHIFWYFLVINQKSQ